MDVFGLDSVIHDPLRCKLIFLKQLMYSSCEISFKKYLGGEIQKAS